MNVLHDRIWAENNFDFPAGEVLLIDKDLEWTSFDVVNKVRGLISKHFGKRLKVGHAGTLDPLASGLVIVCTGKKTKEISTFTDQEKVYETTIRLGATTPSFDLETEVDSTYETKHITRKLVEEALLKFIGKQEQIPPAFSAKKVKGRRAYLAAREGIKVEIPTSNIEIKTIELLDFSLPEISIRIICSKGTYVRALARDIGKELKSGGHLSKLRRTGIGNFSVDKAMKLTDFENLLINA